MSSSKSASRSQGAVVRGGNDDVPREPEEGGGGGGGGDDLVKVAFAPNQMEAEMIQGLLTDHGIPSLVKRGPGFDVPEFMPVGPRQVFVAARNADDAREVLAGTPGAGAADDG